MTYAIVGKEDHYINYLNSAIDRAQMIRINVAFIMESGVKLIIPHLQSALKRGADIQILTGSYLSLTEPAALYSLMDKLDGQADIRLYNDHMRSFHPKSYIFDYLNDEAEIFIGSSNISYSALTSGIEWNYSLPKKTNPEAYEKFINAFNELFYHNSDILTPENLRKYASGWKKTALFKVDKTSINRDELEIFEPWGAQIEALYELRKSREEGFSKGIVVAATGVGKTFLAAFDSVKFKKVLFVAHREEILKQAEDTFKKVRSGVKTGYYTGKGKADRADIYFATVQALGREENIKNFTPDYFDYIVVDEFHHAAAESYLKILKHFNPKFLLGLTATPYRSDNRDIYTLCEDNVVYEIYLKDAINRGLLVSFKYFAIFDETDYSKIEYRNGGYVVEDLEEQLSRIERAGLILQKYQQLGKKRTIGFCASIKHAEYMAEYFSKKGIVAAAVHSGKSTSEYVLDRVEAVKKLTSNDIKVLFCVDIFNEGVDIPTVDTVMFLRPTESFVVFLQQLGRGLRQHPDKGFLTVIDFIGNYKRAHYIPFLLAGENPLKQNEYGHKNPVDYDYPENCLIQFDFKVLDLFKELKERDPLPVRMRDEYYRIKETLNRRPTRMDMYSGSDIPFREYIQKGWLNFLNELNELTLEEQNWIGNIVEELLRELEKTGMTKSYKIPTLNAFLEEDIIISKVSLEKIGQSFEKFYSKSKIHQKDLNDKSNKKWRTWNGEDFARLARRNPVKFLSKGKLFNYDEINKVFYISQEINSYLSPALAAHVRDILEFRRMSYFSRRFKEEK